MFRVHVAVLWMEIIGFQITWQHRSSLAPYVVSPCLKPAASVVKETEDGIVMTPFLHPLFTGHVRAHHCCAAWSAGVIQAEDYQLLYVDKAVFSGLSQVGEDQTIIHA